MGKALADTTSAGRYISEYVKFYTKINQFTLNQQSLANFTHEFSQIFDSFLKAMQFPNVQLSP